jgi:hypothetical protein
MYWQTFPLDDLSLALLILQLGDLLLAGRSIFNKISALLWLYLLDRLVLLFLFILMLFQTTFIFPRLLF